MKLSNTQIAEILHKIADELETQMDSPYRIKAYRRAGYKVASLPQDLSALVTQGYDLTQIDYIGKGIALQIENMVKQGGQYHIYIPPVRPINELTMIRGLGPKRIKILQEVLNVHTKKDLLRVINERKLETLKGFSKTQVAKIVENINKPKVYRRFFRINVAAAIVESLISNFKIVASVEHVTVAGGYRRKKELISKVDLIVVAAHSKNIIKHFLELKEIISTVKIGQKKVVVILRSGMEVTLHIVTKIFYASTLLYLTGSIDFYKAMQLYARKKNYELNKNGLYRKGKRIPTVTEEEIYRHLKLPYIEPELRETAKAIEAVQNHARENR